VLELGRGPILLLRVVDLVATPWYSLLAALVNSRATAQGTGLLTRSHLRELGLQRGAVPAAQSELDEQLSRGREVVDHDAHVLHALDRHALDGSDTTAPATASLGCDRLVGTRRPIGLKSRTIMISRLGLEYGLPALNMY
jgi:hypothetical protein